MLDSGGCMKHTHPADTKMEPIQYRLQSQRSRFCPCPQPYWSQIWPIDCFHMISCICNLAVFAVLHVHLIVPGVYSYILQWRIWGRRRRFACVLLWRTNQKKLCCFCWCHIKIFSDLDCTLERPPAKLNRIEVWARRQSRKSKRSTAQLPIHRNGTLSSAHHSLLITWKQRFVVCIPSSSWQQQAVSRSYLSTSKGNSS